MPKLPVISLFTGAGGFDLGALAAGVESRVCVDLDPDCISTLRENRQFRRSAILCQDVTTLSGDELLDAAGLRRKELGLLIGGPPCQSFSKAAYWTSTGEEARYRRNRAGYRGHNIGRFKVVGRKWNPTGDPRSSLVEHYSRLLSELMPAGFVFENVLSITHPASRPILDRFLRRCARLGYAVQAFKANAVEYGVPQMRQRLIVLGLKGRSTPVPPLPTHSSNRKQYQGKPYLKASVAVGPILEPYRGETFAEPEEVVSGRWAKEFRQIPPGWNYKALTAWAGHRKPVFLAETRFWNFLLKLHPELPSWTIAASPGPWTGPFHWDNRRLRVPELAALQTFPNEYRFSGSKRSIRRQIGNAIPPLLARHVVDAVASEIMGTNRSIRALRYITVA